MLLSTARCIALAGQSVGTCISKAASSTAAADGLEQDADTDAAQVSTACTLALLDRHMVVVQGLSMYILRPAAPPENFGVHQEAGA